MDTATKPVPAARASGRPARAQAREAVRTLIAWAGDDPGREGLVDTPERVVGAFEEWFCGYGEDPAEYLSRTFEDVEGYDDMVLLREIAVESHCEHHLAPFIGRAWLAYLPDRRVVGISKLVRVVELYAKRLQTQEALTAQICKAVDRSLTPRGVAVMVDAKHQCMTTRGVRHPEVATVTNSFAGAFKDDRELRERFLRLCDR